MRAQHVAGNSEPEFVYSAIFAPTDDELFDAMVIIRLDGRAIYVMIYAPSPPLIVRMGSEKILIKIALVSI